MRRLLGALAVLACPAFASSASAAITTDSFPDSGTYTWTVPAGVGKITVIAIGAAGGDCPANGQRGGWGAATTFTAAVAPGQQLLLKVGGRGGDCTGNAAGGAGGVGGGGAGGTAITDPDVLPGLGGAGGGGATEIDRIGGSSSDVWAIAGGGGGAGAGPNTDPNYPDNGRGGDAGEDAPGGGRAGTVTAGGSGAAGISGSTTGFAGSKGLGGGGGGQGGLCDVGYTDTQPLGGGGGGGGYYGGGGGTCIAPSGGGGGSSFLSPSVHTLVPPAPGGVPAAVQITYSVPPSSLSVTSLQFSAGSPSTMSVEQPVTLHNFASRRLLISGLLLGGADPADFSVTDRCQQPLASGASCRLLVRFHPRSAGERSATLALLTNGARPAGVIHLQGGSGAPATETAHEIALLDCPALNDRPPRCSYTAARGVLTLTSAGARTRATLSRGRVVYATGASVAKTHGGRMLTLTERRRPHPGSYVLTLRRGHARPTRTAIELA